MSVLAERAMLARFSATKWAARKHDKAVTSEVATTHKADKAKAGRYHKRLLASDSLNAIKQIEVKARTLHYDLTLPWLFEGVDLLPILNYEQYCLEMGDNSRAFYAAVDVFIFDYPAEVEYAKKVLGTMYKAEDYPTPAAVKQKFGFDMSFWPVPEAGDWRVQIEDEAEARIKADIEERLTAQTEEVLRATWERAFKPLSRMVERLSDPDHIFRDSLVTNVADLVTMLPKLNIMEDPDIKKLTEDLRLDICGLNPQDLRDDDKARADGAKAAKKVLADIEAKMAAFMA